MIQPQQDEAQTKPATSTARLRPLTGRNSAGELYERSEVVQAQIREALGLDADALSKRVRIRDYEAPGYLREECLVYLIREATRRWKQSPSAELHRLLDTLISELVRRISWRVNYHLRGLGGSDRDDAFDSVMSTLFEQITDLESNKGDFLQVKFWVPLVRMAIDEFRKRTTWRKHHDELRAMTPETNGDDNDLVVDDYLKDEEAVSPEVGVIGQFEKALSEDALGQLSEDEQVAFILYHKMGWQIETKLEDGPLTISEYLGVSPRTVRRRLASAEKKLDSWRENML